jgi:geranylgeranyl diphosphate synthase, type II
MHDTKKLVGLIEAEIGKINLPGRQPSELYLPVEYALSNGGKRIRPLLCLMACEVFSTNLAPALKPATAIEIFHNFTLLHDDIMDRADLRRNKPTVHKKWNENVALLSGDAMAVMSFGLISSASREILPSLLEVFNRTALEVCEGQQMDMNFETMPAVNEQHYLEMIMLKTSVLIAAAMKIGAICGGASDRDTDLMYDSGLNLGLAFQLQDDLLDLYGDQESFGKNKGGDIILNKKTFLLVTAMARADSETSSRLAMLMENEKEPDVKVREVKKIYDRLGIRETTESRATSYFSRSLKYLNEVDAPDLRKEPLACFIESVMKRKA